MFYGSHRRPENLIGAIDILSALACSANSTCIGAIETKTYYQICLKKIEALPKNISVRFLGLMPHDELMARFANYHLFFFPTLGENFGHAILEALACGLPALIRDATPWTDLEEHGAGWAFELSSPDRFVEVLEKTYRAGPEFSRAGAVAYAEAVANPPGLEEAYLKTFRIE